MLRLALRGGHVERFILTEPPGGALCPRNSISSGDRLQFEPQSDSTRLCIEPSALSVQVGLGFTSEASSNVTIASQPTRRPYNGGPTELDKHLDTILKNYIDADKSVQDVITILDQDHDLRTTESALKKRIQHWQKIGQLPLKKLKKDVRDWLVRKRAASHRVGKRLCFYYSRNGKKWPISDAKLDGYEERYSVCGLSHATTPSCISYETMYDCEGEAPGTSTLAPLGSDVEPDIQVSAALTPNEALYDFDFGTQLSSYEYSSEQEVNFLPSDLVIQESQPSNWVPDDLEPWDVFDWNAFDYCEDKTADIPDLLPMSDLETFASGTSSAEIASVALRLDQVLDRLVTDSSASKEVTHIQEAILLLIRSTARRLVYDEDKPTLLGQLRYLITQLKRTHLSALESEAALHQQLVTINQEMRGEFPEAWIYDIPGIKNGVDIRSEGYLQTHGIPESYAQWDTVADEIYFYCCECEQGPFLFANHVACTNCTHKMQDCSRCRKELA